MIDLPCDLRIPERSFDERVRDVWGLVQGTVGEGVLVCEVGGEIDDEDYVVWYG